MAWKRRTTCQQCDRRLSTTDRRLGTICSPCVHGNRKSGALYDRTPEPQLNDNNDN